MIKLPVNCGIFHFRRKFGLLHFRFVSIKDFLIYPGRSASHLLIIQITYDLRGRVS